MILFFLLSYQLVFWRHEGVYIAPILSGTYTGDIEKEIKPTDYQIRPYLLPLISNKEDIKELAQLAHKMIRTQWPNDQPDLILEYIFGLMAGWMKACQGFVLTMIASPFRDTGNQSINLISFLAIFG